MKWPCKFRYAGRLGFWICFCNLIQIKNMTFFSKNWLDNYYTKVNLYYMWVLILLTILQGSIYSGRYVIELWVRSMSDYGWNIKSKSLITLPFLKCYTYLMSYNLLYLVHILYTLTVYYNSPPEWDYINQLVILILIFIGTCCIDTNLVTNIKC